MKHVHAELMMQYAKDAMETDRPWERWERNYGSEWGLLGSHPSWTEDTQYRRKPRTININGFEVPEPVREPLEQGKDYYVPIIAHDCMCVCRSWFGYSLNGFHLEQGLIHLTQEAAITHAKALLSFTREDSKNEKD